MKSKVGKPLEQIKDEMMTAIKSQDLGDENDLWELEISDEMEARQSLYDRLSKEELERWDYIVDLFQLRDNDRVSIYSDILNDEADRVHIYYKASSISEGDFREYLIKEIRKLDLKIVKFSFGRELLEYYTEEKFLLLFNDVINHYKPLNLRIREHYEETDEQKIKERLIKLFAKKRALMNHLSCLEEPLPKELHLKHVAKTEEHYKSIIKTLMDECIISQIEDDKYIFKKSKNFAVKDLAHFMNSLYSFGFLRFEISPAQGQTISHNTFGRKYANGNAKDKSFLPKEYIWLKNMILTNLSSVE